MNFEPGQDFFFLVSTESVLVCRLFDCTSATLNKISVGEMCRGVYLPEGLFDDISLPLNVKGLCLVVGSVISAAKLYVVDRQNSDMSSRG